MDDAWEALRHDVFWAARRGLPTNAVMARHRPLIEAAFFGEPDPREFRHLTFDEQRQYMARKRREWAEVPKR